MADGANLKSAFDEPRREVFAVDAPESQVAFVSATELARLRALFLRRRDYKLARARAQNPPHLSYRRAVVDPDGAHEDSFEGLGYTQAGGQRFLSAWHHGTSKARFAYTSVEPNAALAPDDLRPPKQTATWTFGDAPAAVEYDDTRGPRLYVDPVVNGVKGKFLFDTGAGGTAMIDSFARKAGAQRFGTTAIGGSTLHDVVVSSGLDEQTFDRMGVVGLIGFDLLAGTIADLNFDTKTLRLMDPAKVEPDKSAGLVVHVDLSSRHMRAPMRSTSATT